MVYYIGIAIDLLHEFQLINFFQSFYIMLQLVEEVSIWLADKRKENFVLINQGPRP